MPEPLSDQSSATVLDPLNGIDADDAVIHVRIQGTLLSYCGRRLEDGTHVPPSEVTEPSWCPDCVRMQDGDHDA